MVSIGKTNGIFFGDNGRIQSGKPSVQFPKGDSYNLQERLAAIDNGQPISGVNKVSGGYSGAQENTLLARLDAIGTGELTPMYREKNFDMSM